MRSLLLKGWKATLTCACQLASAGRSMFFDHHSPAIHIILAGSDVEPAVIKTLSQNGPASHPKARVVICTSGSIRVLSSGGHRCGHSSGRHKPDLLFASAIRSHGCPGRRCLCWTF